MGCSPRASRCALMTMRRYLVVVTPGIATGYWKAMKSPATARASGSASVMSTPSKRICPSVISRFGWPMIALARVDLPDPFGPISAWNSPERTWRSTPRRMDFSPALTCRLRISRSAMVSLGQRKRSVVVGELDELGQRGALQRADDPHLHARPHQLGGAVALIRAVGARHARPRLPLDEALHRRDRALEREHHRVHRDLLRRAAEHVPAVRAARGGHEAGPLEQRGDALEVGERQVLRRRDGLERHGPGTAEEAQLDQQPDPVFRLRREDHRGVKPTTGVGVPSDPGGPSAYSYASAVSTSIRAARRAGRIAASTPARIATATKATSEPTGTANVMPSSPNAVARSAATPRPAAMPIAAPRSAVMMLSWRIIRRTCRRVMPTARSMPSSRVRSNVESTSVLTIPNSDTITARASSTMNTASSVSMPFVMSVMNPSFVTMWASGKAASAFVTAAGSLVVRNARRSRRVSKARSNAVLETVIGPSPSESSTGDSSIPRTVSLSLTPLAEVSVIASPTLVPCSVAQPSSTMAPFAPRPERTRLEPSFHSKSNTLATVAASTPLTISLPPATRPPSWRSELIALTPGTPAAVRAMSGSIGV